MSVSFLERKTPWCGLEEFHRVSWKKPVKIALFPCHLWNPCTRKVQFQSIPRFWHTPERREPEILTSVEKFVTMRLTKLQVVCKDFVRSLENYLKGSLLCRQIGRVWFGDWIEIIISPAYCKLAPIIAFNAKCMCTAQAVLFLPRILNKFLN